MTDPLTALIRASLVALVLLPPFGCAPGDSDASDFEEAPSPDGAGDPLLPSLALDPTAEPVEFDLGDGEDHGREGAGVSVGLDEAVPHLSGDMGVFQVSVGETFVYRFEIVGTGESDIECRAVSGPDGATFALATDQGEAVWTWTPGPDDLGRHSVQFALLRTTTLEVLDALLLEIQVSPRESLVEYGF